MFVAFGDWRTSAEAVAHECVENAQRYLASDAPVEPHLADPLLLPMALAVGVSVRR